MDVIDVDIGQLSVVFDTEYERKIQKILPIDGRKMECQAKFIEYTDKGLSCFFPSSFLYTYYEINDFIVHSDIELIEELDYNNPLSHGWFAKRMKKSHSSQRTPSTTMDPAAIKYLRDLQAKQPENCSMQTKAAIEVFVQGDRYLFNELEFDNSARAVNEKLIHQYRVSPNGDRVQFFGKKVILTPKELALYEKYYCHTYQGHFDTRIHENMYSLTMFVDNYEFTPVDTRCWGNKCDTLYCIHLDCNACIRPSLSPKGEIVYFSKPHSIELAHSHCNVKASAPIEMIDAKLLPMNLTKRLEAKDLVDADFVHDWILTGKNKRQLLEPETGFKYTDKCIARNNISYWDCARRRKYNCRGRAFGKKINGQLKFASDGIAVHSHNPTLTDSDSE